MKKIKVGLPAVALLAAILASAFTLPSKHSKHAYSGYSYLQQDKGGTELLTLSSPVPPWIDVTDSVDMDPTLYSDEPWHCILSDEATCIVGLYDGDLIQVYDGLSQDF